MQQGVILVQKSLVKIGHMGIGKTSQNQVDFTRAAVPAAENQLFPHVRNIEICFCLMHSPYIHTN